MQTETCRKVLAVGGAGEPTAISHTIHPYFGNSILRPGGAGRMGGSFRSALKKLATDGAGKQSADAQKVLEELNGQPDTENSTSCGKERLRRNCWGTFTTDEYVNAELLFGPLSFECVYMGIPETDVSLPDEVTNRRRYRAGKAHHFGPGFWGGVDISGETQEAPAATSYRPPFWKSGNGRIRSSRTIFRTHRRCAHPEF